MMITADINPTNTPIPFPVTGFLRCFETGTLLFGHSLVSGLKYIQAQ